MLQNLRDTERTKVRALRLGANKADLSEGWGLCCPWDIEDRDTVVMTADGTKAVRVGLPSLIIDMGYQRGRDNRASMVIMRTAGSQ